MQGRAANVAECCGMLSDRFVCYAGPHRATPGHAMPCCAVLCAQRDTLPTRAPPHRCSQQNCLTCDKSPDECEHCSSDSYLAANHTCVPVRRSPRAQWRGGLWCKSCLAFALAAGLAVHCTHGLVWCVAVLPSLPLCSCHVAALLAHAAKSTFLHLAAARELRCCGVRWQVLSVPGWLWHVRRAVQALRNRPKLHSV